MIKKKVTLQLAVCASAFLTQNIQNERENEYEWSRH